MTTIVMNIYTAAVSHYTIPCIGLSQNYLSTPSGLQRWGGNDDAGSPIEAYIETGKTMWGDTKRKQIDAVFIAVKGGAQAKLKVLGERQSFEYPFRISPDGVSKCVPGRGIRENYLGFGVANTGTGKFQLDEIEVVSGASTSRRTK